MDWSVDEAYRGRLAERLACDGPGGHAQGGTCQHGEIEPSDQYGWMGAQQRSREVGWWGREEEGVVSEEAVAEEKKWKSLRLGDYVHAHWLLLNPDPVKTANNSRDARHSVVYCFQTRTRKEEFILAR